MKNKYLNAVLVASTLLFSTVALGQGSGAQTITESVDGNITFNPCNGEGVMLSGSIQTVVRFDVDQAGGFQPVRATVQRDLRPTSQSVNSDRAPQQSQIPHDFILSVPVMQTISS